METKNSVFIATSIDGYISDRNGGIDWLHSVPNPDMDDMGYSAFMKKIDAVVMGRTTFETVCSFDIEWPYDKPVFVLSNSLREIAAPLEDKAFLLEGEPEKVLKTIHSKGFYKLYIDGGNTITRFLKADLIEELIITKIPVLLGGGTLLFSTLPKEMSFQLLSTKTYLQQVSQSHYQRKRD